MFRIICSNCLSEVTFNDKSNIPAECPYCWAKIDASSPVSEVAGEAGPAESLTLIYQSNQQKIIIPPSGFTFIGRENTGAEVLDKILCNGKPVISRKHCSVEFKDNKFLLKDEGSLNGTFYGVNKISCKNNPMVIENNSMIFLGQEAFLANIKYKSPLIQTETPDPSKTTADASADNANKDNIKKRYRCKDCGTEFDSWSQDCPNCETFNSLIEI